MSKYIGGDGKTKNWVAQANRETDRKLAAGLICCACGRAFSASVPKAKNPAHKGCCDECSKDFA